MSNVTRRSVAKGAMWSVPSIAVAGAAPALAASPCSAYVPGQPLPAGAFEGYFIVTNQTFGGAVNKTISTAAGIRLSSAAVACIGNPAISNFGLVNPSGGGTLTLTNGKTYNITGGAGVAGSGTGGKPQGSCSGPAGMNTDACNSYTGVGVANSTGTSSENPQSAAINYTVTVAGYATQTVTFHVSSFKLEGVNWSGYGVTVL